jgi:hypothetical protein
METRVTVAADPEVDVQTLISTLDALRGGSALPRGHPRRAQVSAFDAETGRVVDRSVVLSRALLSAIRQRRR